MAVDRDIRTTAVVAILCAVVVVSVPITALRALFALPLCLVLPGYAITAAIFPRRQLTGLEMAALTTATSLATLVLGALLLNFAPGGLRTGSWAVLLLVVVGAACAVTVARRAPVAATTRTINWRGPRPTEIMLLVFAALAISGALVLSRVHVGAVNAYGYTQFWMVQNGTPIAPAVRIGLQSGEKAATTYRVVLKNESGATTAVAGNLRLGPGGSTAINVPVKGLPVGQSVVTARLYIGDNPNVYRTVTAVVQSPIAPVFGPHDQPGLTAHARRP